MWNRYFKLKGLVPGEVITPSHGTIDFANPNLSLDMLRDLYENDFPYLELTPEGLKHLYGNPDDIPGNQNPPHDHQPQHHDNSPYIVVDDIVNEPQQFEKTHPVIPEETTGPLPRQPETKKRKRNAQIPKYKKED